MIKCEGLTKWYDDFLAVDDLDLELEPGDLFGFIGPNGAGKTTTMKMLVTLLAPTQGDATIGGHSVTKEPRAVRRLVGYMPDFFGVYREMRVSEYLGFFAAAYRVGRRERARVVGDLLDLVDLAGKRDELVGALSRGMQQRLGLARALVHDPKVLVLDEPASGLDPRARVEMREIFRELRAMGKTILLSSHILPELADTCNRIGIIARGRLLAVGTIDEVADRVAPAAVRFRLSPSAPQGAAEGAAVAELAQSTILEYLSVDAELLDDGVTLSVRQSDLVTPHDVAAALVGAGLGIEYLEAVRPSLEEMFLQLTADHELGSEDAGDPS